MEKRFQTTLVALSLVGGVSCVGFARPFIDPRSDRIDAIDAAFANEPRDTACQARTLVSTGGDFPRNPHTLAVRWAGLSNYELVYDGRVILLDTYYDRGSLLISRLWALGRLT